MKNLLTADFFRVRKSKLFLISLILAVAFPFFIVLLYFGIEKMTDLAGELAGSDMPPELADVDLFGLPTVLASAFSLTNNIGLLIPIFSCMFVSMDIGSGTLRNKIIAGKARTKIYLSHLITSMTYNVLIISINFLSTFAFGILFFGTEGLSDLSALYFIVTGEMTFIFIACVSTAFILMTKSAAPSVIFTVLIGMGLSLVSAVVGLTDYEKFKYLVYLIPTFSNSANMLGVADVSLPMFWEGIASYVLFGGGLTVLGIAVFNKKDIK